MSDFWLNFHFIRPWWLLALVLPFLFWAKFYTRNQALSSWVKAIDKNLLPFLLIKGSSKQRRFVSLAALTGFVGAIIALAGPSWQKEQIPSLSPQNPVMMLLDLSTDMNKTDVSPNRLARAKFKIKDLTNLLKSEQSGLAVYTAEPFMITPISDDANLISNLLPEINRSIMPVNGNRPDRAISYATEKLKNAGFTQGDILVISGNGGTDVALTIKAAQLALQSGFKVSVLAIAQVQVEALMKIAKAGGGEYLPLTANDGDIKRFISLIDAQNAKLKSSDNMRTVWLDFGYYLLFIPLLCCLYFFRKGLLTLAFFCLFSAQAQAGFFLNNNQEGMKAFNQQDYAKASQKFERSDWKASSLYKAGDYQAALKEFAKANDVESLYNQGNALAKSGKIDEAIKKYEDVLAQEPNHEDAKFNLEYLKQQKHSKIKTNSNNLRMERITSKTKNRTLKIILTRIKIRIKTNSKINHKMGANKSKTIIKTVHLPLRIRKEIIHKGKMKQMLLSPINPLTMRMNKMCNHKERKLITAMRPNPMKRLKPKNNNTAKFPKMSADCSEPLSIKNI